jgi:RNA polymerase sigma-70 factor (ECF subfamily)
MMHPDSTCWTVIEAAAAGSAEDRAEFARRYGSVVRAYLASRWRGSPCLQELDDAVQDVFVECFKRDGMLERAERGRPGGFHAFLYGVVRNVARRAEERRLRSAKREQPLAEADLNQIEGDAPDLARAFDRAWARAILREAARRQQAHARAAGEAACQRVELLRLRFQEGLPIREIAARWQLDPAALHHEYARARQEFKAALLEVVAFHHPTTPAELERECANLLALLG